MAEIPVRVEFRAPLPFPVRSLPAMEQLICKSMQAHGVPFSSASMKQDASDLVLYFDLTIEEPDDDDD